MPGSWKLKTLLYIAAIITALAVAVIVLDDAEETGCGPVEIRTPNSTCHAAAS